jgi:hypothetical protein
MAVKAAAYRWRNSRIFVIAGCGQAIDFRPRCNDSRVLSLMAAPYVKSGTGRPPRDQASCCSCGRPAYLQLISAKAAVFRFRRFVVPEDAITATRSTHRRHRDPIAFIKMNGSRQDKFTSRGRVNPCAPHLPGARLWHRAVSQETLEDATMAQVKQSSMKKRTSKAAAVRVLGTAGLGFSLASSGSASTMPSADVAQPDNTPPNQRLVLGEEEMADVSLATFYLFDKENFGPGVQLARGCGGCGGCHGCGGCRGGGGCHVGGCGGCHIGGGCRGCVGCRGCGGCGCGIGLGIIACAGCAGCAGCCLSWGACRLC